MPAFAPLIRGGLETLARAQAELHPAERAVDLDTLLRVARQRAQIDLIGGPAASKAQELYAGQHLGGLELYHGSPHLFRPTPVNELGEFDFLKYAGKGEGAQAFGPGSYHTGNPPLAWNYAENLAASKSGRGGRGAARAPATIPDSWIAAYKHDPEGFIEFLRARTMQKGERYGVFAPERWTQTEPSRQAGRGGPGFVSEVIASNTGPYLEVLKSLPNADRRLTHPALGKQAADAGRQMLDAGILGGGVPFLRTKKLPGSDIPADLGWGDQRTKFLLDMQERMGVDPAKIMWDGALGTTRRNLNATEAGAYTARNPNIPFGRGTTYKQSMNQSIDLRTLGGAQPKAEAAKIGKEFKPRLYTSQMPATPTELFSYDFPMEINSPRVVAALNNITKEKGLGLPVDSSFADITGEQFIRALKSKLGQKEAVKTLRDADVPGMYFQRAGKRDKSLPPAIFDPDAHNFVMFDDAMTNIIKREDKKDGGSVVRQ